MVWLVILPTTNTLLNIPNCSQNHAWKLHCTHWATNFMAIQSQSWNAFGNSVGRLKWQWCLGAVLRVVLSGKKRMTRWYSNLRFTDDIVVCLIDLESNLVSCSLLNNLFPGFALQIKAAGTFRRASKRSPDHFPRFAEVAHSRQRGPSGTVWHAKCFGF
jgi:hypothetical protein